jgi:hypothetical protein
VIYVRKVVVSFESILQREKHVVDMQDVYFLYEEGDLKSEYSELISTSHYHLEVASNSETNEVALGAVRKTELNATEFISFLIENGFELKESPEGTGSYFVKINTSKEWSLGDIGPGGGLIFWVNDDLENDLMALEVAQQGWHFGNQEDPTIVWATSDQFVLPKMEKSIGSGLKNCASILGPEFISPAALQVHMYSNFVADWHLPSIEELKLIYANIHTAGLGSLTGEQYWSSSPVFAPFVRSIVFEDGSEMMSNVQMALSVRPIRQILRS